MASKWFTRFLVATLAMGLLLSGCGVKSSGTPAPGASASGKTLNIGLDVDAGTLDPRLAKDTTATRAIELIYDGLVYLDANLKPQPDLAVSWSNPDPTTWIFNLRHGVKWQDGQDFTADDVVYTFTSELDPAFKAPYAGNYATIAKVEAVDTYTVKFTLKSPYAPMLAYMDLGIVPKHIGEKNDGSLATNPIGTGAFKFVKWDKNSKIVVAANKDYWGGAPKVDTVVLNIIPDNTNRVNALLAGDVDLIHSPVSPQDIPRLQQDANLNTTVTTGLGITYFNFNVSDPVLSDARVRQAIASLIDRQTIVNTIYQKMDSVGKSVLLPTSWAYSDAITGPAYDPNKAAELLTAAGYTKAAGKWTKNGKPLTLTVSTHTEDPNRVQTVEFVQNALTEAGITVNVKTAEWGTFSADVYAGKYQIALMGWLNLVDPDKSMYTQFHTGGGSNWSKYSNPDVDKLLDDGRVQTDQAKRAADYQAAAKIVADDVVYDVVTYQGYVFSAKKKVQGFEINPKGSFRSIQKVELTQ